MDKLSDVIFLRAENRMVDSLLKRKIRSNEINIHDMFGHSGKLWFLDIDYVILNVGYLPWEEEEPDDKCYFLYDHYNTVQVKRDRQGFTKVIKNKKKLLSQLMNYEDVYSEDSWYYYHDRIQSWKLLAEKGSSGKAARSIKMRKGSAIWCMKSSHQLGSYGHIARTVVSSVFKEKDITELIWYDVGISAESYFELQGEARNQQTN